MPRPKDAEPVLAAPPTTTVAQLLAAWEAEVKRQLDGFKEHGTTVAEWDRMVRLQQAALGSLSQDVVELQEGQRGLDAALGNIVRHQEAMTGTLTALEAEMDALTGESADSSSGLLANVQAAFSAGLVSGVYTADARRADAYKMAQDVNTMLAELGETLRELTAAVDKQYESVAADPLEMVRQTLEQQQVVLDFIKTQAVTTLAHADILHRDMTALRR